MIPKRRETVHGGMCGDFQGDLEGTGTVVIHDSASALRVRRVLRVGMYPRILFKFSKL